MELSVDLQLIKTFAEALAVGLLIGVERYKDRQPGEKKSAGLRTFTLVSILGAVCALLGQPLFTLVTFVGLLTLFGIGYYRETAVSLGLTTEIAALLTFWLGYLVKDYETLAITTGIVVVILLASKQALHGFVSKGVTLVEFYDTLKFLAVVFVVFPLLPDRYIGPYELFNPTQVWMLVILVSSISYSGYVLVRWLGSERGLKVSALVGGLVSTTAVTMSLAERAKANPELSHLCGVTGIMANAVQFPRLLLLIGIVEPQLALVMAAPLLAMFAVGMGGAWAVVRFQKVGRSESSFETVLTNPYSFLPALKFALLFVGVFALAKLGKVWLGVQGVYLVSAVSGLADASAISLSVADMARGGTLSFDAAAVAILIAVAANALVKWLLAFWGGTRPLAYWLGGGFLAMIGTGALVLALMNAF